MVTYSNASKEALLNVRSATLRDHGAVSAPTAREMAAGARAAGNADVGLAVTGIAGPGGGSVEKPVGLVFIALDLRGEVEVHRHVFPGDRRDIKREAAEAALAMFIERLEQRSR